MAWDDDFRKIAPDHWRFYAQALPAAYKRSVTPQRALQDIPHFETLRQGGRISVDLWPEKDGQLPCLRFYSTRFGYLDEWLPPIKHLGLRVVDQSCFPVRLAEGGFYLRSFGVAVPEGEPGLEAAKADIVALLAALLDGKIEDDSLNGLVLKARIPWRLIDMLRGYRNYYLQLGGTYRQSLFHRALLDYPEATRLLCDYFQTRFDPALPWETREQREEEGLFPLRQQLQVALEPVTDLHADRILRAVFNLIDATVRTNFYRAGADQRLAFKISGLGVIEMPVPLAFFETYVHGPAVEAVHLRGGKVARGGIRWSDRAEDFRAEVWALMRTQMLKNALIVPQGAKGGFWVKHGKRPTKAQVLEAYVTFMRALLDLTDNRRGSVVTHPSQLICYDGDDPYLVVAADRGTADFSDTANRIAAEYQFWLKDAFASGGSHGYDHKKIGITARGAWECAKRHFKELGRELERDTITVLGIGSMDGDVFGNGMLLSRRIKLLAAFSGQHIFLDPNPDPEISYQERRRLFDAVAGWDQYDPALISEGGGVFPRQAKNIPLSSQVRRWLGIRHHQLDGDALIRQLLTAEADMMWLGGIGTYIKASTEKNEDIGDLANAPVRVDAGQLRVKVAAEGANLGFTQKARVEFAGAGGKINIDAIDNSGGVDLSDHEVNLKILLYHLQESGQLAREEPDQWLDRLRDEVVDKVIANNRSQSLALSLDWIRCRRNPAVFLDLADRLENAGWLDRELEGFPLREQVMIRPDCALTRPELAVLLSLSKSQFKQSLQARPKFLCQEFLQSKLWDYFPEKLVRQFDNALQQHPLAAEITSTALGNQLLDRAGATYLAWVEEPDSPLLEHAVALYLTFDAVLAGAQLRQAVLARELALPWERTYQLLLRIEDALAVCAGWFLDRGQHLLPNQATVDGCQKNLQHYQSRVVDLDDHDLARLQSEGFDEPVCQKLALLQQITEFPVLVELTVSSERPFDEIAQTFASVSEFLALPGVLTVLAQIPARSDWESRLKQALAFRFRGAIATLTRRLLTDGGSQVGIVCTGPACLQKFSRYQRLRRELEGQPPADLLPLATLCIELEGMVDALESV